MTVIEETINTSKFTNLKLAFNYRNFQTNLK